MNWRRTISPAIFLTVLLTAGGCGRDEIKVYRIPKEAPVEPLRPVPAAGQPQFTWKTPARWQEQPPGQFRVASFKVTGADGQQADISVIPLPGEAGGDANNINRWRDQVGLPPLPGEELIQSAQPLVIAGQAALLYDLANESLRILGVIQHRAGTAWFFKMTGSNALVAQEKSSFVEFLQSFQFGAQAGHVHAAADGKPHWHVPADWQEVPGGQFLAAKFNIIGPGDAQATVNISTSRGDGGGLEANVNRWRRQLGLAPQPADELQAAVKTVGGVNFVELAGTDERTGQPTAVFGALVFLRDEAWFYKLTGDVPAVAAQREAFAKFVVEVQY